MTERETVAGFAVGCHVYIPCSTEGWVKAVVIGEKSPLPDCVFVKAENSHKSELVKIKDVTLRPSEEDYIEVDDLITLNPLSSPAVLDCLNQRFNHQCYYTLAGSTLVALNPYREVPEIYGLGVVHRIYTLDNEQEVSPHIYSVAQRTYHNLKCTVNNRHQSVIVSGESGAGKTVSGRHLMNYLVTVSGLQEQDEISLNNSWSWVATNNEGHEIEKKILDSNPILEAFGNAATLRNENSSRFGKYVQLQFDKSHRVVGATLNTYLLEKSRVVHQADGEYNFHIFYQLLQAEHDYVLSLLGDDILQDVDSHVFSVADCSNRNSAEDILRYKEVLAALCDIGLQQHQISAIWEVVVGVLLLCELSFCCEFEDDDSCDVNQAHLGIQERACHLIGLSPTDLEVTLTRRRITAQHSKRKSVFYKPCSVQQAHNRRDSMVKVLYARLFEWIASFINEHIKGTIDQLNYPCKKIGILDIYGFESFEENCLEQLCINYANEKLQQHYVQYFLRELQEEYLREAVDFSPVDISDNMPSLRLIEGKNGMITLLDEVIRLNRPMDGQALADHVTGSLTNGFGGYIKKAERVISAVGSDSASLGGFSIMHYVQPVVYSTHNLLDKNKDDVPVEIVQLLQQSDNALVQDLVADYDEEAQQQQGMRKKTVLTKFKLSLNNLMQALEQTEPHYIRCIKPNSTRSPSSFNRKLVFNQLRACGLEETVTISKQTYPARMEYTEFLKYFHLILRSDKYCSSSPVPPLLHSPQSSSAADNASSQLEPLEILYMKQLELRNSTGSSGGKSSPRRNHRRRAGLSSADHSRKLCATIMKAVFGSDNSNALYQQFGRTLLYLKNGQLEELERARLRCLSEKAFTVQCAWRRYQRRARVHRMQCAVQLLQREIRGWLVRRQLQIEHKAATVIQRAYRSHVIHKSTCTQPCDQSQQPITDENSMSCEDNDESQSLAWFTARESHVLQDPQDGSLHKQNCSQAVQTEAEDFKAVLYHSQTESDSRSHHKQFTNYVFVRTQSTCFHPSHMGDNCAASPSDKVVSQGRVSMGVQTEQNSEDFRIDCQSDTDLYGDVKKENSEMNINNNNFCIKESDLYHTQSQVNSKTISEGVLTRSHLINIDSSYNLDRKIRAYCSQEEEVFSEEGGEEEENYTLNNNLRLGSASDTHSSDSLSTVYSNGLESKPTYQSNYYKVMEYMSRSANSIKSDHYQPPLGSDIVRSSKYDVSDRLEQKKLSSLSSSDRDNSAMFDRMNRQFQHSNGTDSTVSDQNDLLEVARYRVNATQATDKLENFLDETIDGKRGSYSPRRCESNKESSSRGWTSGASPVRSAVPESNHNSKTSPERRGETKRTASSPDRRSHRRGSSTGSRFYSGGGAADSTGGLNKGNFWNPVVKRQMMSDLNSLYTNPEYMGGKSLQPVGDARPEEVDSAPEDDDPPSVGGFFSKTLTQDVILFGAVLALSVFLGRANPR